MKLLLTSNGLSNDSIAEVFEELIGKSPDQAKVIFIPTAANPIRDDKGWLINDLHNIGRRGYSVDIIDLAVIQPHELKKALNKCDAIFVGGGNSFYLSYWMKKSGFFE